LTLRLLHVVSLRAVGGIQRDFANFISADAGRQVEHHVLLTRPGLAPAIASQVSAAARSIRCLRHWSGIPMPAWSRQPWLSHVVKRTRAEAIVLWSAPRALQGCRVPDGTALIYYEHGAAWFNRDVGPISAQMQRMDGVVCNSGASSRMVSLRWGFSSPEKMAVCPNAVVMPAGGSRQGVRQRTPGQPLRLGVAGRLQTLKGVVLAVHAVKALLDRGVDVSLKIAGTGPEHARIQEQVVALGLVDRVELLGFVDAMDRFYESLDLLLCPSIHESFGLVCAEAMSHGLPVVCTAVDGLSEVVLDGEAGRCVAPTLSLEAYPGLGGIIEGVPSQVYDPVADAIAPARLIDPVEFADAVQSIVADPGTYERFSRGARERAAALTDYDAHVADVLEAIDRFIALRGAAA